MKAGVGRSPCAVRRTPARASPSVAVTVKGCILAAAYDAGVLRRAGRLLAAGLIAAALALLAVGGGGGGGTHGLATTLRSFPADPAAPAAGSTALAGP